MADATVLQTKCEFINRPDCDHVAPSQPLCLLASQWGGGSLQVALVTCASAALTQYVFWLWLPSLCSEVRRFQALFVPCAYDTPGQGVGWGRKQLTPIRRKTVDMAEDI